MNNMIRNTLEDLLIQASRKMRLAFETASKKYKTPDDIAHHREDILKDFLTEYFPKNFQIGKGEIIDSNANRSKQIDVVICNPYHPFTVSKSGMGLFFAEGVACAIEVKSDLSNKQELERAILQIKTVKRLERKPTRGDLMFGSEYDQKRLKQIPCVVFAYNSPSLVTVKKNILEKHEIFGLSVRDTLDAVVVLDRGILYNIKDVRDSLNIWVGNQRKLGLVGVEHGEKTLMNFLFYLSHLIPREVRITPIISIYLQTLVEKR